MDSVKTAISIRKPLFEQADDLARRMQVSRSRLFVMALEDYIRRRQNQELLAQINAAYTDEPDPEEQELLRLSRFQYSQTVEGEW